ncbi:DUF2922 domain-containing protein [Limosilactobacillus pontis]|jgi:hypothetical protein|uniref:DUF2922 domain-containing protein n=2 Tax=Limosilactobacillus pontis TaxID=35787 RepID=A0ABU7SUK5_9LACO|nr:DUF2922 domain-containing protein [Limosilactobacillus pontis]KRM37831.1 hypothetical protein FD34_GL000446 [Limosilactobacillus pontis DSM 8475]QFV01345.1 DUF2922 family protein [Limosilactobacillus pontis]
MKSLNLTFKTNKGKKHLLKLSYANSDLDAKTVRQAMDLIAAANLFVKGDEQLCATPLAAKYVDTVDTVLFNDAEKTTNK